NAVLFLDEVYRLVCSHTIARLNSSGKHPPHVGAGGFCKDLLSPVIESNTPGVGYRKLRGALEVFALGTVPVKTTVCSPHGAVWRLDIGMQKGALAHVDGPGGIRSISTVCMVCIMIIKSTEQDITSVGFVIAICIGDQYQVSALRNIYTLRRQLETDGQM